MLCDVGSRCADEAGFKLVQLFLGEGSLYDGIRTDLNGNKSDFMCDIGYFGVAKQNIDINLIVNHIGKKTNCGISVDGALKDAAKRYLRELLTLRMVRLVLQVLKLKMCYYWVKML